MKIGNMPPKTMVYTGMLRKTPISPYIWWFWVVLGGYYAGWLRYGYIWVVMVIYGLI